ncbi:hypothetical protein GCM10008913_13680 [Leuconostoc lactis KCTC 3528 = DSM 20202]|uniref:hypothetical protein n=1 Tax=Leuconostoc lactis TaxID=1246 RepID=UPI0002D33E41|nr:hypothetical protein [Leuconostoc lactis]GHC27071.1 hypothetical protein GCM10008913_13680 [Leuconostoc lactis KCTC 3528 = DSM 20202]
MGILWLGRQTQSTAKQETQTASQAQSSSSSQASSQSQATVSLSSASSQVSSSQPETTQQSAENSSSSSSTATNTEEQNDHANLEHRDQPVTISASDIQATRSILRNAGIDDKKFTDKQIEDLMNQSVETGKPIPDLAR